MGLNPYSNIDDRCLWSRGVMRLAPGLLDPVADSFLINSNDKIATMGSCFAQHISKFLRRKKYNFYFPESGPQHFSEDSKNRLNYGMFSARYGNVYTTRQAVQLFLRAYNIFNPCEAIWELGDKYVDPFRPTVQPGGFNFAEEVEIDRESHLKHVRSVFENSDVLIFTLGLTEGWAHVDDAAVYPIAPGVVGGSHDSNKYLFFNQKYTDVYDDLSRFMSLLREVNPRLRIILTVSPVPLIATYERRHVLSSTVYSKSVLCAAANDVSKENSDVIYFPSYEIITSPLSQGRYFNDDMRTVSSHGVGHVLKLFENHFLTSENTARSGSFSLCDFSFPVVCDEEAIERYCNRDIPQHIEISRHDKQDVKEFNGLEPKKEPSKDYGVDLKSVIGSIQEQLVSQNNLTFAAVENIQSLSFLLSELLASMDKRAKKFDSIVFKNICLNIISISFLMDASVTNNFGFCEKYYFENNPDISHNLEALQVGSGFDHWRRYGFFEKRPFLFTELVAENWTASKL